MKQKQLILSDGTVLTPVADTKQKRRRYLKEEAFIIGILIIPFLWWLFGFIYMTGESILMAFRTYDRYTESFHIAGQGGFANFIEAITDMTNPSQGGLLSICLSNSLILWSINTFVQLPISVIISFALHKKVYGQGAFKIILMLPSIISSSVWVLIYSYLMSDGLAAIYGVPKINWLSPLKTPGVDFWLMIAYQLWLGLASGMVIYTGAMSRVPESLVEAGHLDGMRDFQEFIHIVIPLIFPTLSVVLTTAVMSIFTASLPTYQFFAGNTRTGLYTFGHYMFAQVMGGTEASWPLVSAISCITCLISTPFTMTTKHLLAKYGPTVEY